MAISAVVRRPQGSGTEMVAAASAPGLCADPLDELVEPSDDADPDDPHPPRPRTAAAPAARAAVVMRFRSCGMTTLLVLDSIVGVGLKVRLRSAWEPRARSGGECRGLQTEVGHPLGVLAIDPARLSVEPRA